MEVALYIFSGLGIGAGLWTIIDRIVGYRLERKKILFDKKYIAFAELSEYIFGLTAHKKPAPNLFESLAASAKARLLISDMELDRRINNFFVDLDALSDEKDHTKGQKIFNELQKEGGEIVKKLKRDLESTL